jgi:hypothetical protein
LIPDPKFVALPFALVPCQYQTTPAGGLPRLKMTESHCGELDVGVFGALGTGKTVTASEDEFVLQQPAAFRARR